MGTGEREKTGLLQDSKSRDVHVTCEDGSDTKNLLFRLLVGLLVSL